MDRQAKKTKRSRLNNDVVSSDQNQDTGSSMPNNELGLLGRIADRLDSISNRLDRVEKLVPPVELVPPSVDIVSERTITLGSEPSTINTSSESGPSIAIGNSNPMGVYFLGAAPERPKFSGGKANPNKFLKQLERYIKSINGQNQALDIAIGSLTGSAQKILELYSDNWNSFEDFRKDLLDVFWGSREREVAKNRLIDSTWSPSSGTTMEEYFAEVVDLVKDLQMPLNESEIVGYIMRHYPQDVQIAWFANRAPSNYKSGLEFLRNIEKNVRKRPYANKEDLRVNRKPYQNRNNRQFSGPNDRRMQTNLIEFVQENAASRNTKQMTPVEKPTTSEN